MNRGGRRCCPPTAWQPWGPPITASVDGSARERRGLSHIPAALLVRVPVLMGCEGVSPAPSRPLPTGLPNDGTLTPSIQSWHSPK